MKIWLLSENWEPNVGGVATYLSQLAQQLASSHELDVFVPPADYGGDKPYVHRIRFFWLLLKPAWWPSWHTLSKRANQSKPDLLICGKALFEGRLALRLKKKFGVPYVICTYAMEVETWARNKKHRRHLERVLSSATAVLYINERTKATLRDLGATDDQLVKLAPGVGDQFFRAVSPALAESTARHYGIHAPYILSVGRLIERKGFDLLLRAFGAIDQTKYGDVELIIVGEGPERGKLEAIIDQEYLSTSVKLIDHVPAKHLAPLMAGAKVFALTPRELETDFEGFGIVYLEAAAVGTPSLGTRTGGVTEAVVDGETGLLAPVDDEKKITAALEQLLGDTTTRDTMGEQAQARAKEKTWTKIVPPVFEQIAHKLTDS